MNRTLRILLLALPVLAAPLLAGCDTGESTEAETTVTVMTRNLYLGGDLFLLLQAQEAADVPPLVQQLYFGDVVASDPAARMDAIAEEIEAADPDLVGLQEVSLYRTQSPSDYVTGTTEPNATTVAYDFLGLLLDALEARGLDYTVAATNTNADVELPATADGASFTDVRLTDRDVILVREGTTYANVMSGNFAAAAPVPIGGVEVEFTRGYSFGTAKKDDVTFTFANSHFEVGGPAVQAQQFQAAEMVAKLQSARSPVVLVGDFNSDPSDAGADGQAYRTLTAQYTDVWTTTGSGQGFTCCQAANLRNTTSELSNRIDLVLFRGDAEGISADLVGEDPEDRTPGDDRLWPSDHAGVVATLRVRN